MRKSISSLGIKHIFYHTTSSIVRVDRYSDIQLFVDLFERSLIYSIQYI